MNSKYLIAGGVSDEVVTALSGVQDCVERLVADGYRPVGGVTIFRDTDGQVHAAQVVFKEQLIAESAH